MLYQRMLKAHVRIAWRRQLVGHCLTVWVNPVGIRDKGYYQRVMLYKI